MPTYEYRCERCGLAFDRRQAITEAALDECPDCGGPVHRLVSGGSGFILKEPGPARESAVADCSLQRTGRTCCGRSRRCETPSCGEKP